MAAHFSSALLKYGKLKIYGILAVIIVLIGTLLRALLIIQGWPITNSDEAVMHLMALHILQNGEHPIFFYGQNYMGVMEAYLGAVVFRFFGASVAHIELSMLLFFILSGLCTYWLVCQLYSKKWALVTLIILDLGSNTVLFHQIQSIGGYPELCFLEACSFALATYLALSSQRNKLPIRLLLYAAWGIVVGLALWTDLLIIPYLLVAGLVLVAGCWRDLLKGAIACVLLGVAIGAWPLIYYNLHAVPGQDSISVFRGLSSIGADPTAPFQRYVEGALVISLPNATGFHAPCMVLSLPFPLIHHATRCEIAQSTWSLGYIALLVVAALMAVLALWFIFRRSSPRKWSYEERQDALRQFARLMLLCGAALTLGYYIHSPASIFAPSTNSRYLSGLLVSTPALLWPLWHGIGLVKLRIPERVAQGLLILRFATLLLIICALLYSTTSVFSEIPSVQAQEAQQQKLIDTMEHMHVNHFYTDYWTCTRLIFAAQEKLICSNLTGDLSQDWDRYQPYGSIVSADPHPGYVFKADSSQVVELDALLKKLQIPYQRVEVGGYIVYKPANSIPIPQQH